jgi:hypothetical protein
MKIFQRLKLATTASLELPPVASVRRGTISPPQAYPIPRAHFTSLVPKETFNQGQRTGGIKRGREILDADGVWWQRSFFSLRWYLLFPYLPVAVF